MSVKVLIVFCRVAYSFHWLLKRSIRVLRGLCRVSSFVLYCWMVYGSIQRPGRTCCFKAYAF